MMLENISLIARNFDLQVYGFYTFLSHSLFYIVIYTASTHIFSFFLSLYIIFLFAENIS